MQANFHGVGKKSHLETFHAGFTGFLGATERALVPPQIVQHGGQFGNE